MSNDSPVKGFRKLGGGGQQPSEPVNPANPWPTPMQQPAPSDPFSAPPSNGTPPPQPSPVSWPSNPYTPDSTSWQSAVPPTPPGASNVPNPPPAPPWQAIPQQSGPSSPPPMPPNAQPQYNGPVYGYTQPVGPNPNTAYLVELIGGLFGFFGIGYMYAGKTSEGVVRLVIGIACNIIIGISAALTVGICAFIALPVYIVVAITSAGAIKNLLLKPYQNP